MEVVFSGNGFPTGGFKETGSEDVVQRDLIMIKNCLFAVALLSLALAGGCAKGGNGVVPPPPTIAITYPSNVNPSAIYPTQSVTLTATVSNSSTTAVTWSLGPATTCTGTPNPCGTLTPVTPAPNPATATYLAPATPISGVTVTATLVSDTSVTGPLGITVVPVTVVVTPLTVSVGQNLVQQFTAIAVPDAAPQTFTWTCTPSADCPNFQCTPSSACGGSVPGVAVYTAPATSQTGVQVTATSTVQQSPLGVGASKVSVVSSRLPAGTFAFQFSGYDSSGNPVAIAGSLTVGSNGAITGGVEDVVINGVYQQYTTVSGSYTASTATDNNTNNAGTLTLSASGGPTYTYTAVLTSSGIVRMIESSSDGTGITGSGVLQKSSNAFNTVGQTYAFGFTGVDSSGKRVGYVGMLPMTPNSNGTGGTISGGLLDSNDNGTATTSVCATPPCSVTGSYLQNANGSWQMTLNTGTTTLGFDFYVSAGTAQTKTGPGPLTLYAISTDPITTNPAVSGSMVYQVPMTSGYNNAAFKGTSVSNLTGASANVSLTVGTTDGTSSGTGGTGGFTGVFDQNDHGTITSVPPPPASSCAPPVVCAFSYTYVASSSANGRYIFQMLGNPNATTVVPPLPFVLYASGANRGFLLDQSSPAVMTGTMDPQPSLKNFSYTASELPGTFAAATIGNSDSSIAPVVQNLLLTSTGNATYNVAGTQNTQNSSQALTGTYNLTGLGAGAGTGTITLTAPAANYVIYAIDANVVTGTANDVITDFMMMGLTSGTPSSIIFAQQ